MVWLQTGVNVKMHFPIDVDIESCTAILLLQWKTQRLPWWKRRNPIFSLLKKTSTLVREG